MAYRLGLSEKTIENDYVLTWTLYAISASPLRDKLAFKGGTAIKKVYVPDYRFSEDLDFTLLSDDSNDALTQGFQSLSRWLRREVDVTLTLRKAEVSQAASLTLYLNYVGPLRGSLGSRFFKVDITRGEKLLFALLEKPLLVEYSDCQGRLDTLLVYSLEEILTEKLCALLGRTEPRDLFDVHYLLQMGLVDTWLVATHFTEKCRHKGLDPDRLDNILTRRRDVLDRLWGPRLEGQMAGLPHLDAVIRETRQLLRREGIIR